MPGGHFSTSGGSTPLAPALVATGLTSCLRDYSQKLKTFPNRERNKFNQVRLNKPKQQKKLSFQIPPFFILSIGIMLNGCFNKKYGS